MSRSVAKITRPTPKGISARPRLFGQLEDVLGRHRIAWVSAPPGSGKTTLAASWVAERNHPCLWYQLDPADADPATFFYYAREAIRRLAPRRKETLPLLTPEYALGIAAYARSFLQAAGARIPSDTVLVLDDYQDLPEGAPLQAILPQALPALPDRTRVVVLSRSAPPAAFARLIAEGAIGLVDGEALNLTEAETQELARLRVGASVDTQEAAKVHGQTGGWVAGTLLLLEAPTRVLPPPRSAATSAQQVLFDYFASEAFERAPADAQRLLLATAVLREVSVPAAGALSGEPRAAEVLADLVHRNYFTVRIDTPEPRYRFHPIFREFLLARARRKSDSAEWRATARRAADLLVHEGCPDEAAEILADAGAFDELAQLVRTHAAALTRQGRVTSVESWLRALPAATVQADPWLSYWLGVSRSGDRTAARAAFESAYRVFRARADLTGALLAWAGCVSTYLYVWDEFRSLDRWIAEMEGLIREVTAFPSVEIEAQVTRGMFASLFWRAPAHRDIGAWERRAIAFLDNAELPPELRMQLAEYPVFSRMMKGDYGGARQLVDRMRPLLREPKVTPLTQIFWCVLEAAHEGLVGDSGACFAAVDGGLAIANRTGVLGLNHLLAMFGVTGALAAGDLDAARAYHSAAAPHLGPGERMSRAHHLHLGAWIELCAGDVALAEERARTSLGHLTEAGPDIVSWGEYTLGHVLVEIGRYDEAVDLFGRALAWARRSGSAFVEHDALLSLAYAHVAQGRVPEALAPLRRALRLGHKRNLITHTWIGWRRDVMSRLAALALEHGIEVEHVRRIVHLRRLLPPDEPVGSDAWPWPVRVRVLGAFELWRNGERASFTGKLQRKPLELLWALVALGGTDVREDALLDVLWPHADGDAAAHALETTVYRLRKLLGATTAVLRQDRRVSLNPRVCWVDAFALSRRLALALELVTRPDAGADDVRREAERILELYRGPVVATGEEGADPAEPMRARLRAQVSRFLDDATRHLERAGGARIAAALVARARAADPALRT